MAPERILFEGARPDSIKSFLTDFRQTYLRDGVAILPGFLKGDPLFEALMTDLRQIARHLSGIAGVPDDGTADLANQLTALAKVDRALVGKIYDLGTRPNKLLSGMMLKLHPAFIEMTKAVFDEPDAIIATPSLSDTLHVFPPGADSYRFNLPIHQDYPYLLQSPDQVTFWISMSKRCKDVGGMTVWCGSHHLGIRPQRRDTNKHLECVTDDIDLTKYEEVAVDADYGDVVVFHSNILHRSEKNHSKDGTRIVQLFRFSDLKNPEAERIGWDCADINAKAKTFEQLYPEKILEPVA